MMKTCILNSMWKRHRGSDPKSAVTYLSVVGAVRKKQRSIRPLNAPNLVSSCGPHFIHLFISFFSPLIFNFLIFYFTLPCQSFYALTVPTIPRGRLSNNIFLSENFSLKNLKVNRQTETNTTKLPKCHCQAKFWISSHINGERELKVTAIVPAETKKCDCQVPGLTGFSGNSAMPRHLTFFLF